MRDQGRLFYGFQLEDRIPENHLLRRMNVFVTVALADLHKELEPHCSAERSPRKWSCTWPTAKDEDQGVPQIARSEEAGRDALSHLKTHHCFERMRLRGLSGARDECAEPQDAGPAPHPPATTARRTRPTP